MDRPVLLGDKSGDFLLALDDQAQSDGLDASGGKAAADFVPEQRRNFVTDDAIEHAAGLPRVHQGLVDLGGGLEGSLDSFLRDFVEHHAIDFRRRTVRLGRLFLGGGLGGLFVAFFFLVHHQIRVLFGLAQDFSQVGADGFAFAVRVARQVDGICSTGGLLQIVDYLNLAGDYFIGRLKDILGRDGYRLDDLLFGRPGFGLAFLLLFAVFLAGQQNTDRFLGQVHHVAVGSLDQVIPAQILVDCFRLSRRFDDYQ